MRPSRIVKATPAALDPDELLSLKAIGDRVGLSRQRMSQLKGRIPPEAMRKEGREILVRWGDFCQALPEFAVRWKPPVPRGARGAAAADDDEGMPPIMADGMPSYADAQRAWKHEQFLKTRLSRLEEQKQLMKVEEVHATWSKGVQIVKTRLLSVANTAKQRLPHLRPEDVVTIDELIRDALEEIAAGKVAVGPRPLSGDDAGASL